MKATNSIYDQPVLIGLCGILLAACEPQDKNSERQRRMPSEHGAVASAAYANIPSVAVKPMGTAATNAGQAVAPVVEAPLFDFAGWAITSNDMLRHRVEIVDQGGVRAVVFGTNSSEIVCEVRDLPTGTQARTMLVLARMDTAVANSILVSYGLLQDRKHCGIAVSHQTRLFFWSYGADLVVPAEPQLARWMCVAFTYDGETGTLFVNGNRMAGSDLALDTVSSPLRIGARGFVGSVAHVRVWNKALTPAEVLAVSGNLLDGLTGREK